MKTYSPSHAASHITLASLFQDILHKLSAAAAERRVRRQKKATLQEIERMDARLLDDIGIALPSKPAGLESLAKMNPAFLAATAFSLPRNGRR